MKLLIMKIIYKIVYFLHKLFPKHIPIMSCYGCMVDNCIHRSRKGNMICYYHKKNNRKIKTLVDLIFLQENNNKGEEMKEDLLKIIDHYGLEEQLKYIHTEYFELDEAIIAGTTCADIASEIADVMVMLRQFQYYFSIEDEKIENIMKYKIERQLERIKGE